MTTPSGTSNSPSQRVNAQVPTWAEKGVIADVDMKNWTVDIISEYSGKFVPKVPLMCPYLEATNGAGIYVMPEVGTVCYFTSPSDSQSPFVLGFVGVPKSEKAQQDDLTDKADQPGVENEEDLPKPSTAQSTGESAPKKAGGSFRSNRPDLNPGDIALVGHDGNFIYLRRGGVIQIGTTPTCQTMFIPVLNYLRQFCENFEMSTPGGAVFWRVDRQEGDPAGEAPVIYRLTVRDKAQNDKADVQVRFGHVSDDIRYELVIAPKNVKVDDGSASGENYTLRIKKSGDIDIVSGGKLTEKYTGGRETTVMGSDKLTVTGTQEIKVSGAKNEEVMGTHSFKAAVSMEVITGVKTIDAAILKLGNGPLEQILSSGALLKWLGLHSHEAPKAPPTQAGQLAACLNPKFMVPKP